MATKLFTIVQCHRFSLGLWNLSEEPNSHLVDFRRCFIFTYSGSRSHEVQVSCARLLTSIPSRLKAYLIRPGTAIDKLLETSMLCPRGSQSRPDDFPQSSCHFPNDRFQSLHPLSRVDALSLYALGSSPALSCSSLAYDACLAPAVNTSGIPSTLHGRLRSSDKSFHG